MRVTYITIGNAQNIHNWSGLEYYISKTLEEHVGEVSYLGDIQVKQKIELRPKQLFYRLIGQRYDAVRNPYFAEQCAQWIGARLNPHADIVFSPGSVATAFLDTAKPKVIYSDATFAGLLDFYVFNYCQSTIKKGHYVEQIALDSAKLAIYSSDYAAQSAIRDYNTDPEKVKVVPFGANVKHNFNLEEIKSFINRRSKTECHLLFLGVNWRRKGGDLAVDITKRMNEHGIKTILHVAGIKQIPLDPLPPYVKNHGFISKSTEEGENKLLDLMARSHFLLLPTRAEAYGLVFCEANSMGLPAISTDVGGIPTIIRNDINGKTFDISEKGESYVRYLTDVFEDKERYRELALSSYNEFCTRLNWKVAGKAISSLINDL